MQKLQELRRKFWTSYSEGGELRGIGGDWEAGRKNEEKVEKIETTKKSVV
jgi:hypothetical protein